MAGKWAKTCLSAISSAAFWSKWTRKPVSFLEKLDDRED
jgi:hypothetical protein